MPAELHIDAHLTPRATLMYPAFAKFSLQLFLMIWRQAHAHAGRF
eukprot:COSAG06_NODE_228_length_19725_cov_8.167839_7_plen_45_part_00